MPKTAPRWPNIEFLVKNHGGIAAGQLGPTKCVATAADEDQQLAMLVRRPRESLETLLTCLDAAIEGVYERQEYIDEVNG